jgi:biotin transport system substrate-specific component
MTDTARPVERHWTVSQTLRATAAVVAGALLVALGAQISVPLPGTPVPVTFQVPAALIVGGLIGSRLGATSLVFYLVLGAAGLPVFAPIGLPGIARLFGPTGGYLLALPLAAAVMGVAVREPRAVWRLVVGLVAGLAVIYAGGLAQLAVLNGSLATAWTLGSAPFLVVDTTKLVLAGLVVGRFRAPVHRALR